MFSKAFMDELVKPQRLYSHRTLKTVLTRVAHTSIMRLSPASMDRVGTGAPPPTPLRRPAHPLLLSVQLYELMIMAFKYQVFLCPRPKDLLLISYNHIDAIRELVKDTPAVVNHVDETHRRVVEVRLKRVPGPFPTPEACVSCLCSSCRSTPRCLRESSSSSDRRCSSFSRT